MNSVFLSISTLATAMILAEGRYLLVEVPEEEVFTSTLDNPEGKKTSIYLLSNLPFTNDNL